MLTSPGYDVPLLSEKLDWISVMVYDYHGQWDEVTGHVAPMYEHPDDADKLFNAVRSNIFYAIDRPLASNHSALHTVSEFQYSLLGAERSRPS